MNKIKFTIPLEPKGQMRARRGKIMTGKDGRQFAPMHKAKQQEIVESRLLAYIIPHAPAELWTGPIMVELTAYMEVPGSWANSWRMKCLDKIWPTKKPDLDNIVKNLKDCMTGIIYHDDAQVVGQLAWKMFGAPRWEIIVSQIPGFRHDAKKGGY